MFYNSKAKAYFNILRNNILNLMRVNVMPRFAHIYITWKCNLKCKDCSNWKKDSSKELSSEEWISVIKKLSFLDIVKITGGEPFEREDIVPIIKAIRTNINPYILQITTNGTYTSRIVNFIKKIHFPQLHLRISLDGIGEVHDAIRGQSGCYKKTEETLFELIALRKHYPFHLGINYGLRENSLCFLDYISKLCNDNSIGLILGYPVKPFLEDIESRSSDFKFDVATNVIKAYREYINFKCIAGSFSEKIFNKYINRYFLKLESSGRFNFCCGELKDLIYIFPQGDLVTCGLRHAKVANFLNSDFNDIWFSDKIKSLRKKVKSCPGCLQKSIKMVSEMYNMSQLFF